MDHACNVRHGGASEPRIGTLIQRKERHCSTETNNSCLLLVRRDSLRRTHALNRNTLHNRSQQSHIMRKLTPQGPIMQVQNLYVKDFSAVPYCPTSKQTPRPPAKRIPLIPSLEILAHPPTKAQPGGEVGRENATGSWSC